MSEIMLSHFSIPKLIVMREGEVSLSNITENLRNLWNILWTQSDGLIWNATAEFGLYFKHGFIIAIFGGAYSLYETVISIINRQFNGHTIIILQFLAASILGALVSVNINRINCIHISIIAFIGIALYQIIRLSCQKFSHGWISSIIIFGAISCCFTNFTKHYFTDYSRTIATYFHDGLQDSVDFAMSIADYGETIYISSLYSHSKILLFSNCPVDIYLDTVEYTNYPSAYLNVKSFWQFSYEYNDYDRDRIYIVDKISGEHLENRGYTVHYFGETAVVS